MYVVSKRHPDQRQGSSMHELVLTVVTNKKSAKQMPRPDPQQWADSLFAILTNVVIYIYTIFNIKCSHKHICTGAC